MSNLFTIKIPMICKTLNADNFFSKPVTFLVIIYPLLSVYGNQHINLGMICMFALLFSFILAKGKIGMRWPKYFWLFFLFMSLTRFLNAQDFSLPSLFSLSLISFTILLGLSCKYFDLHYGIKIYEIVVLFCSSFFFIQEIMYFSSGFRVVGLAPWLPINNILTTKDYINMLSLSNRSASFFLEPSQFAEYIIPLLAIELFNGARKKIISFYVVLISVVTLLLGSGTGAITMAIIWIVWFFYYVRNSYLYKKLILTFLLIPGTVFGIYYYLNSEIGKKLTERQSEFSEISSTTSAYVRIIRGFDLFADFPVLEKIFGLNSPTKIKSFISDGKMYWLFGENDLSFSGLQSVLIYGGIMGLLLFFIHFGYLFKKNQIEGKMLAVAFIGLSIISPIYLTGGMLLCYAIIFSYQRQYFAIQSK